MYAILPDEINLSMPKYYGSHAVTELTYFGRILTAVMHFDSHNTFVYLQITKFYLFKILIYLIIFINI